MPFACRYPQGRLIATVEVECRGSRGGTAKGNHRLFIVHLGLVPFQPRLQDYVTLKISNLSIRCPYFIRQDGREYVNGGDDEKLRRFGKSLVTFQVKDDI